MKSFKKYIIIPARFHSTRLPQKMLLPIQGKPLIYYSWKNACNSKKADEVVIATDHKDIFTACKGFKANVVMTKVARNTGTDRVGEAAKILGLKGNDVVVNVQGDEPILPSKIIDDLFKVSEKERDIHMITVATRLKNAREIKNPSIVKVVLDKHGKALYFSRSVIPFPRSPFNTYLRHIGVYLYRTSLLEVLTKLKQTPLEKAESLEQLRALENGYPIRVLINDFLHTSVDTEKDFKKVKKLLLSHQNKVNS